MAEDKKKQASVFQNVLTAINGRRKTFDYDYGTPVNKITATPPTLDKKGGIENMQQQYLDWQVHKIAHDLYTRTVYYDTDRISSYQDFRAMDGTPEIAAAMSIIRDECLEANTIIPLLNGEKKTIEELYQQEYKNFYVYSYDPKGEKYVPSICERVTYKGEQDVYEIVFDDDSTICATSEHLWLKKGENKYIKTSELKEGQSIEPFYEKKSVNEEWILGEVKEIKYKGREKTYDLVNVGEFSNFAILTSNGTGVISHNCLTRGESGDILRIYSENKKVKEVLKDLFGNVMNIEFNLRLWIRDLVKYGDYFVLLNIDKDLGIYDFLTLPMEEVHREEGYDGRIDSTRFRWETTGDYFEEWQVAHFRLLEDSRRLPYGKSLLDSSRKLWKQLQLAEDAMLVYRLCLTPETRIRTDNGYKYIKDIVVGDKVISYTPDKQYVFANVTNQVNNGVKKVLKVKSIHKEIICTETHPILVNENGVIKYVDAKDLKIKKHQLINTDTSNFNIQNKKIETIYREEFGKLRKEAIQKFISQKNYNKYQKIAQCAKVIGDEKYGEGRLKQFLYAESKGIPKEYALKVCDFFSIDKDDLLIYNKGNAKEENANFPEYVNEEFARLFGFLLGDGWLRKNEVGFAEGDKEHINKYYADLMFKFFGKVRKENDGREGKLGKYISDSTHAADIFRNLGFITGAHNKRIPEWVFNLSANIKKEFVLGICDADGCIRKTKKGTWQCTIELCNKKLIEDIKELWTSINLSSGILKKRNRKGGHIIDRKSGRTMSDTVCFSINLSQIELPEYENVISVEDCGESEVYDITVDNILHNFIANGTPVHNTRAPDRRAFFVDVGNLPDADVKTFMMQMQERIQKQPIVDMRSGNQQFKYNPPNVTEDFWIPIRGDKSGARIETLPGATNMSDIQDIEYLQNKLFAALQVPKNYLNYSESLQGGSTLAQADLRFARTITSIQEAILLELRRVANIHLYFLGMKDEIDNFSLTLTNPSSQQELLKLETMKARLEVFKEFFSSEVTSPTSYTWAMENVLGFSKSEIKLILKQKKVEKKVFAEIESAVETYKKIGLFDELDDKYEDPEAAKALAAGQLPTGGEESGGGAPGGGGGGGGSSLGGQAAGDLGGGGGGMEAGAEIGGSPGGGEAGATPEAGAEEEKPEEEPKITENIKILKKLYESDNRYKKMIDELVLIKVEDEAEKTVREISEKRKNSLFENNSKMNLKTNKLLRKLNESFDGVIPKEEGSNILLENNEANNLKTQEIFDVFDKLTDNE